MQCPTLKPTTDHRRNENYREVGKTSSMQSEVFDYSKYFSELLSIPAVADMCSKFRKRNHSTYGTNKKISVSKLSIDEILPILKGINGVELTCI